MAENFNLFLGGVSVNVNEVLSANRLPMENAMTTTVHERIKHLIEGTHEAFESYGAVNTDYAGFAAMAIAEFKDALANPELTAHELRAILRKGSTLHGAENTEESWAGFMARYVARSSNNNVAAAISYGLEKIYAEES